MPAALVPAALLGFSASLSFADRRRWAAEHVVLDTLSFVPPVFVALLLIPGLAWWAATLIALITEMVLVPLIVRRRTARLVWRSDVARTERHQIATKLDHEQETRTRGEWSSR